MGEMEKQYLQQLIIGGDGGQGTPWLYPKHFQGLSGWAVRTMAAGNNSLFALAGKF